MFKNLFKEEKPSVIDEPHVIVKKKEVNRKELNNFIDTYNRSRDLKFEEVPYRPGGRFSAHFGLAHGFKMIDGNMDWGWVRLHAGVDVAAADTHEFNWGTVPDVVRVPFHADRSAIYDYGDTSYGTLILLYNDEFKFDVRIGHMNPDQKKRKANEKGAIVPWSLNRLKKGLHFEQNWVLGSAGSYGWSTGAHTHTEIKSYEEECDVLEALLIEKYGDDAQREYSESEVIQNYKLRENYKKANNSTILRDYQELRKVKRTLFLNEYKVQYVDAANNVRTRYSSYYLFGI